MCATVYGGEAVTLCRNSAGAEPHPGEAMRDGCIQRRRASMGTGACKASYDGELKDLGITSKKGGLKGNKVNIFRTLSFD